MINTRSTGPPQFTEEELEKVEAEAKRKRAEAKRQSEFSDLKADNQQPTSSRAARADSSEELVEPKKQREESDSDDWSTAEHPDHQVSSSETESDEMGGKSVELELGDEPNHVANNLEIFEALASGTGMSEPQKLYALYTAMQKSSLCSVIQPYLEPSSVSSYESLKNAITSSLNQTSTADVRILFSPQKRDPLAALRAAKKLNPTATEPELVDMLYKHLSATAIALVKGNANSQTPLADKIRQVMQLPSDEITAHKLNNINRQDDHPFSINKLQTNRQAYGRQSGQQDRRDMIVRGLCYYHTKFGRNATKCRPGCECYGDDRGGQGDDRLGDWPELHPSMRDRGAGSRPNWSNRQQQNSWPNSSNATQSNRANVNNINVNASDEPNPDAELFQQFLQFKQFMQAGDKRQNFP